MSLVLITPPPFEPVTLDEAKEKLRITVGDESPSEAHPHDDMIERHIRSARMQAEKDTGRAFIQQTWRLLTDRFPWPYAYWYDDRWWSGRERGFIQIPRPPLISVDAIAYYDTANASQDIALDQYYVEEGDFPRLFMIDGFAAPTLYPRTDALRIDFTVGYAPGESPATSQSHYAENVPDDIKDAILLGVELLYRSMDSKTRETTEAARMSLLNGYLTHPFA